MYRLKASADEYALQNVALYIRVWGWNDLISILWKSWDSGELTGYEGQISVFLFLMKQTLSISHVKIWYVHHFNTGMILLPHISKDYCASSCNKLNFNYCVYIYSRLAFIFLYLFFFRFVYKTNRGCTKTIFEKEDVYKSLFMNSVLVQNDFSMNKHLDFMVQCRPWFWMWGRGWGLYC